MTYKQNMDTVTSSQSSWTDDTAKPIASDVVGATNPPLPSKSPPPPPAPQPTNQSTPDSQRRLRRRRVLQSTEYLDDEDVNAPNANLTVPRRIARRMSFTASSSNLTGHDRVTSSSQNVSASLSLHQLNGNSFSPRLPAPTSARSTSSRRYKTIANVYNSGKTPGQSRASALIARSLQCLDSSDDDDDVNASCQSGRRDGDLFTEYASEDPIETYDSVVAQLDDHHLLEQPGTPRKLLDQSESDVQMSPALLPIPSSNTKIAELSNQNDNAGGQKNGDSLVAQLAESMRVQNEQAQLISQLHRCYSDLLTKHAIAEVTIDQLRMQSAVRSTNDSASMDGDLLGRRSSASCPYQHYASTPMLANVGSPSHHRPIDNQSALSEVNQQRALSQAELRQSGQPLLPKMTSSPIRRRQSRPQEQQDLTDGEFRRPALPKGRRISALSASQSKQSIQPIPRSPTTQSNTPVEQDSINTLLGPQSVETTLLDRLAVLQDRIMRFNNPQIKGISQNELFDRIEAEYQYLQISFQSSRRQWPTGSRTDYESAFDPDGVVHAKLVEVQAWLRDLATSHTSSRQYHGSDSIHSPDSDSIPFVDVSSSLNSSIKRPPSGSGGISEKCQPLFCESLSSRSSLGQVFHSDANIVDLESAFNDLMQRYNMTKQLKPSPNQQQNLEELRKRLIQLSLLANNSQASSSHIPPPNQLEHLFTVDADSNQLTQQLERWQLKSSNLSVYQATGSSQQTAFRESLQQVQTDMGHSVPSGRIKNKFPHSDLTDYIQNSPPTHDSGVSTAPSSCSKFRQQQKQKLPTVYSASSSEQPQQRQLHASDTRQSTIVPNSNSSNSQRMRTRHGESSRATFDHQPQQPDPAARLSFQSDDLTDQQRGSVPRSFNSRSPDTFPDPNPYSDATCVDDEDDYASPTSFHRLPTVAQSADLSRQPGRRHPELANKRPLQFQQYRQPEQAFTDSDSSSASNISSNDGTNYSFDRRQVSSHYHRQQRRENEFNQSRGGGGGKRHYSPFTRPAKLARCLSQHRTSRHHRNHPSFHDDSDSVEAWRGSMPLLVDPQDVSSPRYYTAMNGSFKPLTTASSRCLYYPPTNRLLISADSAAAPTATTLVVQGAGGPCGSCAGSGRIQSTTTLLTTPPAIMPLLLDKSATSGGRGLRPSAVNSGQRRRHRQSTTTTRRSQSRKKAVPLKAWPRCDDAGPAVPNPSSIDLRVLDHRRPSPSSFQTPSNTKRALRSSCFTQCIDSRRSSNEGMIVGESLPKSARYRPSNPHNKSIPPPSNLVKSLDKAHSLRRLASSLRRSLEDIYQTSGGSSKPPRTTRD